ncbi:1,4-alpha-glucan branching enzyme GlgB,glycogen branching enzyme,1,4-alpha-glucan branching enzyme,Carbohydrate-binding module 48 (Isoamylase N-terminal domain) [Chlamydia serpentis]|uniref:1,4-alpha-glucan branching enzyme GlgB n=1 Tax=Chlamydia serpentis TaxID=1967782 RepID=A0A2R8FAY5_9CHLA|nr:1,4-alpha-glucan branching protein GlgB [Chlamydia serpentis]SPN73598.1 1,4-alpha-glucan branching enzyme GlgB,glycogen branching enzyme,1,4-alpha-glucan branching enzyme,Carbohydrate-binding module 48 (Isoamylase N-terminal domain) [Chlamydia serpentis]
MVDRLINPWDLDLLVSGKQKDPHKLLGILPDKDCSDRIILFRPGARRVAVEFLGEHYNATPHHSGLFSLSVPKGTRHRDYRVYHQNGLLAHDPYAFPPMWGEVDSFLFHKGTHYRIYERMGAIPIEFHGISGVLFVLWAPHAQRVSVVGDFNFWHGLVNPLRKVSDKGIWELFVPGLEEGSRYKWEIVTKTGSLIIKTDPYGKSFGPPPQSVAIVADSHNYSWNDRNWIEQRAKQNEKPILIYEVHFGSWQWHEGRPLSYSEMAHRLARYCKEMHYTHVELLPITEHPLNESWGYQVTGYYAPTSRYGSFHEFQYFVDYLHQEHIGVILDWVPGHFPIDDFALASFDGEPLYEYTGYSELLHPHWNTLTFDYSRNEVSNFLIGSALFWLDKMHIDGLRVDAVASMLYLDYGRQQGEWTPNIHGGKENLASIEFLKHLNSIIHKEYPGVLTFAEESTAFPGVTKNVDCGGLGFDYKWNLGWMHDTFHYFAKDPIYRAYHQKDLTFSLWYAFDESFILPLSHDEVVHGKGSLIKKLPGDSWTQFAQMRLLLSYQICLPGKKLLFMGGEFGQYREWSPDRPLDWELLDLDYHRTLQRCIAELNALYITQRCLWIGENSRDCFAWIDFNDEVNNVIAYYRFAAGDHSSALLCVHHFSAVNFPSYILRCEHLNRCELLFNTDDEAFGGSGQGRRLPVICQDNGIPWGLDIELPPLATLIYAVTFL